MPGGFGPAADERESRAHEHMVGDRSRLRDVIDNDVPDTFSDHFASLPTKSDTLTGRSQKGGRSILNSTMVSADDSVPLRHPSAARHLHFGSGFNFSRTDALPEDRDRQSGRVPHGQFPAKRSAGSPRNGACGRPARIQQSQAHQRERGRLRHGKRRW